MRCDSSTKKGLVSDSIHTSEGVLQSGVDAQCLLTASDDTFFA